MICYSQVAPGRVGVPLTMADDWEVVVPSRAVSPAPLALSGLDASQQAADTEPHAPEREDGSNLHVFAAPWASPAKVGASGEDSATPERQASPEPEAGRLGGSAVFVSTPPPVQEKSGPSVATPMQVVKPAAVDSSMDLEAETMFSRVGGFSRQDTPLSSNKLSTFSSLVMRWSSFRHDRVRFMCICCMQMSSSMSSNDSADSEYYYSGGMSSGAMTLVLLGIAWFIFACSYRAVPVIVKWCTGSNLPTETLNDLVP